MNVDEDDFAEDALKIPNPFTEVARNKHRYELAKALSQVFAASGVSRDPRYIAELSVRTADELLRLLAQRPPEP